jgi:hypothetical protein
MERRCEPVCSKKQNFLRLSFCILAFWGFMRGACGLTLRRMFDKGVVGIELQGEETIG